MTTWTSIVSRLSAMRECINPWHKSTKREQPLPAIKLDTYRNFVLALNRELALGNVQMSSCRAMIGVQLGRLIKDAQAARQGIELPEIGQSVRLTESEHKELHNRWSRIDCPFRPFDHRMFSVMSDGTPDSTQVVKYKGTVPEWATHWRPLDLPDTEY